jgi:hypothetical protein
MLETVQDGIRPSGVRRLAKTFSRLGWAGFWLQVVFGSLSIVLMVYLFVFSGSTAVSRRGLPFVDLLTVANLLILGFTVFWSYRYTRLARRLANPEKPPPAAYVTRAVWVGVVSSTIGMVFSMIVLLVEAATLLFLFLKAPQGGIPVIQTSGAESVYWVSAVDMLSLIALILTLFAELIVLVFSLWLLVRTTLGSPELPQTANG